MVNHIDGNFNPSLNQINTLVNQINSDISGRVPNSTTINGYPLSGNINLLQSDIPIKNIYYVYIGGKYSTIQSAINQAVSDGAAAGNTAVIFVAPKTAGYVEDITLPPWVNLYGMDSGKGYGVVVKGQITYTPVVPGDFSTCANLYIQAGAGKSCYVISGSVPARAYIYNSQLEKNIDTTSVMSLNNPNATITFNYVYSKHNVSGGTHIINSGHILGNLMDLSGGGQAVTQSTGSTYLTLTNFDVTASAIISATGTSTVTLGNCALKNSQANSTGILAANNVITTLVACFFDIPSGTGKIVSGPNTTLLFYDIITTANLTGIQSRNTSLGSSTTVKFTQI